MTAGKGKTIKAVKISVAAKGSWKTGGLNIWSTGHFLGGETILYDNVIVYKLYYMFVKTPRLFLHEGLTLMNTNFKKSHLWS